MGFARADCEKALKETAGRVDEAATWLTSNAKPLKQKESSDSNANGGAALSGCEVYMSKYSKLYRDIYHKKQKQKKPNKTLIETDLIKSIKREMTYTSKVKDNSRDGANKSRNECITIVFLGSCWHYLCVCN